ncbi:MAG: RdgB/HAM1 family non-canonical purine NTP pyrophosphatase [Leptospiraceae bacterium]|nr:RdgB/HAM1 family non-canonical purine NTP pyrophosphatase [Leptospiraceae bacterium]
MTSAAEWLNLLHTSGLLIASNNPHKIHELRRLLEVSGISVFSLAERGIDSDVAETAADFAGNARLKAAAAARLSGMPSLADDSGLCVDALDGAPGVYSARYGSPELDDAGRVQHLLQELEHVKMQDRQAHFHCSIVLVAAAGGPELLFEGQAHGQIAIEAAGSNGFGYDPVFIDAESGIRFSELSAAEKDRRSHRGKALRKLAAFLQNSV